MKWQFPLRHPTILLCRRLTLKEEDRTISKALLHMILGAGYQHLPIPIWENRGHKVKGLARVKNYMTVEPKCLSSKSQSGDIKVLGVCTKQTETLNLLGWTYEPRTIGHLRKDSNPPTAGPRSDPPAPGTPLHCVFPLNKNILIEPQSYQNWKLTSIEYYYLLNRSFLKFYWLSHWCLWKQMQKKTTSALRSSLGSPCSI